jgi:hypothetical protein
VDNVSITIILALFMTDHTILFQKAYDTYRLLSGLIETFPKMPRYAIGSRIDQTLLEIIEQIVTAETTTPALKDRSLVIIMVKAEIGIALIQLALERKLIGGTNFFTCSQQLKEIAKMANGWRKSLATARG